MSSRRKSKLPPVALGGVVEERAMPLAWVEYPEHYGSIFRFAEEADGPYKFCSCSTAALINLARLNDEHPRANNADPSRLALLDSLVVPRSAAQESIGWALKDLARLTFLGRACHRCNTTPPSQRWCHEMYGTPWQQAYGWFPYLCAFEGGVDPRNPARYLRESAPAEIAADLEEHAMLWSELVGHPNAGTEGLMDPGIKALRRSVQAAKSRILRHFTSNAREAFGFKRVGEGWVSETMLFRSVQVLFPAVRIIRHYRPEWLQGLELDIYLPTMNLGLEYQGEQHSSAIKHWGGDPAHEKQRERDARKRNLCREKGCQLVEVWAGTPLDEGSIFKVLMEAGVSMSPRAAFRSQL